MPKPRKLESRSGSQQAQGAPSRVEQARLPKPDLFDVLVANGERGQGPPNPQGVIFEGDRPISEDYQAEGGEKGDGQQELNRPLTAKTVDRKKIETFQYTDVNRALKQSPGVYAREEDGQGLRPNIGLRGTNRDRSKKISIYEDGVLAGPAPYSAPAAYYMPSIGDAESLGNALTTHPARLPVGRWVVSDGPELVTFRDGPTADVQTMKPPVIHEVSPTGSGDVLFAVVIHSLYLQGASLREALEKALPLAAANAAHPGIAEFP